MSKSPRRSGDVDARASTDLRMAETCDEGLLRVLQTVVVCVVMDSSVLDMASSREESGVETVVAEAPTTATGGGDASGGSGITVRLLVLT